MTAALYIALALTLVTINAAAATGNTVMVAVNSILAVAVACVLGYLRGAGVGVNAILIPERAENAGPLRTVTYRVLTAATGNRDGLIVFLDDAERILSAAETAAYADGRADQAQDGGDSIDLDALDAHELIGRTSLGTPEAKAMKAQTPPEIRELVRLRIAITAACSELDDIAVASGNGDIGEVVDRLVERSGVDYPCREPACTDLDATWCPTCGRCSCDVDPEAPWDRAAAGLDPDCPLHGIYTGHAGQDPVVVDPEPDEPDLRECWGCTADRPATDDPCLYCHTPASRWTVGEKVTGRRTGIPSRHGQTGTVERVDYSNNGAPFYYVRWPDTSGRGTVADGPYDQRELADPEPDEDNGD